MKFLILAAATLTAYGSPLAAQVAAPSVAPAATTAGNMPIETLMASPTTKAAVAKQFPDLEKHPAYDSFKTMTLRDLAPMSGGAITEEKITALEAELKAKK